MLRAPAGFGKSTAVAHWLQDRPEGSRARWVPVSDGDGDAFWAAVLRGIDPSAPQPEPGAARAAVERAVRASDEMVLVLDGLDRARCPEVDRALVDLLWAAPALRVVVTVRGNQHLGPGAGVGLQSATLGPRELAFSEEETAHLLRQAGGDEALAPRVHAATGGWPEPTVAAVLALPAEPADPEVVATRATRDFLRRHLAAGDGRPPDLHFAAAVAILEQVTADAARRLTEDRAAAAGLDRLAELGVLRVAADGDERTYRWWEPARRALLDELRGRYPSPLPRLHARAAGWYLRTGRPALALAHALDAADPTMAAAAVDAGWRSLLMGNRELLLRAVTGIPLHVLETHPRALAVRDIMVPLPDHRLVAAIPTLPSDRARLAALGRGSAARDTLDTGLAVLVALRRRGQFRRAEEYASRLLQVAASARATQPGRVTDLLAGLSLQCGQVRLLGGDVRESLPLLQRAYEWAQDGEALGGEAPGGTSGRGPDDRAPNDRAPDDSALRRGPLPYVRANAAAVLAAAHALLGDPVSTSHWLGRHDTAPDPESWLESTIRSTAAAGRLLLALDRLDLPAARAAIAQAPINRTLTDEMWAIRCYAHARHALHTGDIAGGLDLLARGRREHPSWLDDGGIAGPLLCAAEVDLLLAAGRGNHANAVLRGPRAGHPLLQVGRARLALLAGDHRAALHLATDAGWAANATHRDRLEMLLIRAVASHRAGDAEQAERALRHAVDTGGLGDQPRAAITVPREDLAAIATAVPAAVEILAGVADHAGLFPDRIVLVQLTGRERALLGLLAEGRTVQQIAQAQVVSPNTIKSQRRTLYQKLGAVTRAEALATADAFDLLAAPVTIPAQRRDLPRTAERRRRIPSPR